MHTLGPWRAVRTESGEYYTHHIETKAGHIASIAGWSCPGTVCPTTAANARLIEHAPDLAFNLQQLLAWSRYMGEWHASCWDSAQRALDRALGEFITPGIGAVADTRSLLNKTGMTRAGPRQRNSGC
jgi:hypothetical protein